jgi:hypothetical protein
MRRFIEQRDPYLEDLVLTISRTKKEKTALGRFLPSLSEMVRLSMEQIRRRAVLHGGIGWSILFLMVLTAALGTLQAARNQARKESALMRYGHAGQPSAGTV